MPIGNNSGRIMSGYKKWLTNKQRKRLSGIYKGLRQSTADEMRDQYLDQRGSMNRVRDVASSYGLGEGYRARKQMTFNRAQEQYGRQLAMQADNAFEGEVVKAANESIQAENERKQKEYARRLKAAQNKRRAAQNKYKRDMAAYNEQQARLERLRKMKTPKTAQTWKAPVVQNGTTPAHVSPFSWQAHTLTQYTDTGTGNNSPKGGGKSGLIAAALLAGHTGKRLAKGNGTTKPRAGANNSGGKISGKVGRYTDAGTGKNSTASPTQKMIGRPDAPNFETDPSFALPLEPQMQAQLDVQLKEYQAATPEQQEQIKLGAKEQYAKDVAQYAGAMERLNTLQRGVQQAQSIMAQFQDLEAKVRNTRYSPEQRRGFSQQLSGLQRQYASVMQQQRGASQEISGLQRYIQNAFPRINASRALLGGMGIKYDIDSIAFDADWVRRGNQLVDSNIVDLASNPNRQSDRAKEFWKRADAIGIDTTNVNVLGENPTGTSYTATGQRGSTISMTEPEREWFDANGFGKILRAVERDLQYNTQYASLGDAVRGYLQQYGRQSFDYQRNRNANVKMAQFARLTDEDRATLIQRGEEKVGLSKLLQDEDERQQALDDLARDATGVSSKHGALAQRICEKLGLPTDYVTDNTVKVLRQDPISVAFIDYCIAAGDTQALKDYLYETTEYANAAAGAKQADDISNAVNVPFFREVHEFFIQMGFGSYSLFDNIGKLFAGEATPTEQWQYTSSGITQNKIERGWNPFTAQAVDSAAVSLGNNATAMVLGSLIGGVGSAAGGVVGKIASHAPGAIMGASAAGQAKQQALREGYGAKAASMYGIFNGISETVLQENVGGLVGFGDRGALTKALTNAVNSVKSPVARTLIKQGLDILSEIGEEEFGNIVENINRSVTLGEKRGLFEGVAEQAGETAVSTAISTFLLNALHIPAQLRNERGYSTIAKASGMSLKDAKFLLETQDDITNGKSVDPKDLSRYNELTAVLTSSMPENVAKAIADGKMTVADWVTSNEGVVQGKLTGKLTKDERTAVQTEAVDHTEALKGKTDEQRRDYLLNAAPTGKVGSAYYTTTDGKKLEFRNLDTTQKANYVLAQKCAKAFEGSVDVVIHDTLPLSNGAMVGNDGKLHIALDVTDKYGESIAYWTLAHEAGHALKIADRKAWNEMFGILTDYAKNYKDRDGKILYDALVDSITNQYDYANDSDAFNDEMFSLIAENIVGSKSEQWAATLGDRTIFDVIANDRNASAKAKRGFLGKLKASVEKLSRQLRDGGFSKERKHLAKIREQLTEAYKRINEAPSIRDAAVARQVERKAHEEARKLREQIERREGFREGLKAHDAEFNKQKEAREKKARDDALLEEILKGFEKEDRIKASNETGVYIDEKSESANPTMMSLRTWNNSEYVKQRDKTAEEMAKELGISVEKAKAYIDNVNSIAKMIAEDQTRLDYEAAEGLSPFVSNAEYGGSLDFSTICKKRRLMTGTISAIQKALRNSTLTRDEILDIRNMMKERGYEVSCGLCYVEGSRAKMGEFCAEFIKLFKKHNPNAEWVPDMYDVNTPDGAERMRLEHPDVYKQYEYFWNNHGTLQKGDPNLFASQQKPKLFQKATEYTDEILVKFRKSAKNGKVAEKNKNGGLRLQSFSDFEIIHLLDAMQAITDMSRVGLAGQAYTKVPDFAWALGDTGVKINLSLISKGVDENGHIILDEVEGMPRKDAEALRNRYSDNVGTILVVFNDEQLKAAMADDFIDFIIPFHVSQWNSNLYEAMGLPKGTKDYTQYQNEHFIKKTFHEHNGKMVADKATNFMPNEYWDFDKTGKENAEAYLKLCAENNKVPKFSNLLVDNGDGSWSLQPDGSTDGYWKLLIDFKMYNNDGKGVPQMPVQPNFNMEEAQRMLNDYKGGHENFPVAQDVVDDFIKNRDEPATRHSLRATDTEYLSLAEKYRDGTATEEEKQQLVQAVNDAAKRKMPNLVKDKYLDPVPLFHGTRFFGYTSYKDTNHATPFIYTSTLSSVAAHYAGDQNYAFRREIGRKYNGGDSIDSIIQDAKSVWGVNYKRATEADKSRIYKDVRDEAVKVADKLDALHTDTTDILDWDNEADQKVLNAISVMEALFWDMRDGDNVATFDDVRGDEAMVESLLWDIDRYEESARIVKDYYYENAKRLNDAQRKYFRYLAGYDLGDAAIDVTGRIGRMLQSQDILVNPDGGLSAPEETRKALDASHNIGAYTWYGDLGENPFEFDANGGQFYALKVPEVSDNYVDTDTVCKWALEHGYTSVIMHNIYDYGDKADNYVFFSPSQIKSADPVTYDDNGDIIPLSERFNAENEDIRYQQRDFRIDFNVPQLDTKALHEAVKGGEGTVENRFEVKYEKTDSGFAVHITDKDSGKTYDRAETVTEGNAKAEAERAAAAVIRNIKRGEQRKAFREYADKREADARLAERMHEGAIRARIERKANETEAEYKARIKKIYEDRYRREIKNTALKWNKKLVDMLARPTENKHVPVQLARSVAEFCEEVTKYLDGTTKRGEKILDKIRKAYDRAFTDEQTILRAKSEDAGYDARGAVLNTSQKDEQLAEMLKELSEITAEKSFAELTRDEMDALLNVVRGVAYAVTDANKLIGEAEGKTVWQTGSTMIEQLENAPKVSEKLRGYLATSLDLRRLARIFSGSNEDAEFVKLVEQLNQGAIEKERVAQELQAIFKPVTDEYGDEIKKWYGKKAEWINTGIIGKDGLPVKITKGMRVSLALHVLNEGNMRHIERGGLTIPDAKLYAQGKLADAYANGKLVRLTAEQINDIIANMTEAEKAYVEAAKQLFHDRAGFYVNKTSLQLVGYTKANVENYFPIHTDENFNMTDFVSMVMNGSIEGQGFLQERKNASNPIYLEDITSVVNRQIRGVALYAGMAIPVRNFNAVMKTAAYEDENGNWVPRTTVKQTLAKTMGKYGAKVVEGFVEDASEMSQRVDVTPVERIAGKLATNYVKAVLLGNLKVAMKQVASYPTAAAVIPWKYLNKALVAGGRNHRIISRADVDLINKYTPLYQMRREGNANEVASLMNKPGMEQKLPWLLGWITKMDVMTVGRLWSAAEYMVEDTHKDLTKGSDEFYREVAKVFNQTIQQTQPNFTPLQRSAALRSKNPIVRSLTLFGTQRMQNGGILIEAAYELKQAKGKSAEEIAAARRKLGRAVASQVTQNLLLLLATIAVDALRGRMKSWQDDDDELTLESIGKKMGDTFLSNILGSFLGGSEFYETISNMYKKANGQTTYDTEFSVPALDAIETIMSFGQSGIPNFINYLNGDHTDEEKLNKLKSFSTELAKVAGYATGLPLENAVKDVFKGFYPAYKDIRDWRKTGELIPYLWQSGKLDSAKTRARYEDWIDSGHKGSEFFALDKQLKNAVGGRDGRAEILWNESSLSPEDKAKLMEMYDTSDGYAEGSKFLNKNGKELYDFAAEPTQETEAPTEVPSEETAVIPEATTAPAASEAPAATTTPKSDKYTKAAEKWSPYGVTASQAKTAVEKWEKSGNASEYRSWLSKQGFTGRQKFAMYAQANADVEEKAVNFNKKYGTKYEALWDAYSKYDSNSFHGEEYRAWVEKQTNDYRQRFSLVEFAEPRSNWIEHAEELHKAGVSYEAVWKAARYAKNQSGTGKKDRIIKKAKSLGMTAKQAENIYKWFG